MRTARGIVVAPRDLAEAVRFPGREQIGGGPRPVVQKVDGEGGPDQNGVQGRAAATPADKQGRWGKGDAAQR